MKIQDLDRLLNYYISRQTAKSKNNPDATAQNKIQKCKDLIKITAQAETTEQLFELCINLNKEADASQKEKTDARTSSSPVLKRILNPLLNNPVVNYMLGTTYSEFSLFIHACRTLILHRMTANQNSDEYKYYQDFVIPRWESYLNLDKRSAVGSSTIAEIEEEALELLIPLAALGFHKAINELDKMNYFQTIGYENPEQPGGLQATPEWSTTALYPNPNRPLAYQTRCFNDVIERFMPHESRIQLSPEVKLEETKQTQEEKRHSIMMTPPALNTQPVQLNLEKIQNYLNQYTYRRELEGNLDTIANTKITKCKKFIERTNKAATLADWIKICIDLNNEANVSQQSIFMRRNRDKSDFMLYLHACRSQILSELRGLNLQSALETEIATRWKAYERLDDQIANGYITRAHAKKDVIDSLGAMAALGDKRAICELSKIKSLNYWSDVNLDFPTAENKATYANPNIPLAYHDNWHQDPVVNQNIPQPSKESVTQSTVTRSPGIEPIQMKPLSPNHSDSVPPLSLDEHPNSNESQPSTPQRSRSNSGTASILTLVPNLLDCADPNNRSIETTSSESTPPSSGPVPLTMESDNENEATIAAANEKKDSPDEVKDASESTKKKKKKKGKNKDKESEPTPATASLRK